MLRKYPVAGAVVLLLLVMATEGAVALGYGIKAKQESGFSPGSLADARKNLRIVFQSDGVRYL